MSYDQSMKHWKNHRKDKYFQPCAAPANEISEKNIEELSEEISKELSKATIDKIISGADRFPLFIHQDLSGAWSIVPPNHLFGTKIESHEQLVNFAIDYA